jgi:pimeloyl-ACP methyl ester carboxylesterase
MGLPLNRRFPKRYTKKQMPKFTENNISINYQVYGTGKPLILRHGAIINFDFNYVKPGWVETLTENGFQVIGIDFRGYGESDKSNDPNFYGTENFSNDVINLINHLQLENVGLMERIWKSKLRIILH